MKMYKTLEAKIAFHLREMVSDIVDNDQVDSEWVEQLIERKIKEDSITWAEVFRLMVPFEKKKVN
tara:strand:- start:272 stop:466 length:195 start_codon:yes stop_codon:yes gene_type:complete